MGEARRKKLAGYVPEPREEKQRKEFCVGAVGRGRNSAMLMAMLMAMSFDYPKLPSEIRNKR